MIARAVARAIFPNCPRYIPKMQIVEPSPYIPCWGEAPDWKGFDEFKDVVHPRQPSLR